MTDTTFSVNPAKAGIYIRINSELDPRLKHSGMTFGLMSYVP